MRFVVLGSSGFVGSHIVHQLTDDSVLTHHHNPKYPGSIRFDIFNDTPDFLPEPPATLILAAAIEFEAEEQVEVALQRLLPFLERYRVVYLSSDGIFDGGKGNYSETDEPHPTTLYGRNLLTCETLIRSTLNDHVIVRPSYVFGSAKVLDKRLKRVKVALGNGEELRFFDDMYKSPLGVGDLARAVVELASSDFVGTLHVAGERMSIYAYYQRAMDALDVNTIRLLPGSMPATPELLRDTSLNSEQVWRLLNWAPKSLEQTLTLR